MKIEKVESRWNNEKEDTFQREETDKVEAEGNPQQSKELRQIQICVTQGISGY